MLGWLVNPNIALLLLVGGALLIYLEFNAPGTIVPGALGTLMVLLGIFGLNLLPIRYTAVLLLVAALVLLVLEAKFGGHGALAIAGIVCLTVWHADAGGRAGAGDGVSPWVAIGVSAAFGGITVFLVRLAVRARRRRRPARRGRAGGQRGFGHGAADAGGPCAGGRRDLARGGQRAGARRERGCAWWATSSICCAWRRRKPQTRMQACRAHN